MTNIIIEGVILNIQPQIINGLGGHGAQGNIVQIYATLKQLLLSLADLIGLVGSLRVYIKWHNGEAVNSLIINWVAAIIFILIVTYVLGIVGGGPAGNAKHSFF